MTERTPQPRRIQRRRTKGWRKPPGAVDCTRSTKYGNHYVVGDHGVPDAATAVALYRRWLMETLKLSDHFGPNDVVLHRRDIEALRGRDLMCWCREGEPCHADMLLALANAADPHALLERLGNEGPDDAAA